MHHGAMCSAELRDADVDVDVDIDPSDRYVY